METTFNFNRFMLLVRRQWISLGKIYLMAWVVLAGLLLFSFMFFARSAEHASNVESIVAILEFRSTLFVFLGLFYMTIISSSYFSQLGQKAGASFELLLPASRLEKFITALFYTVILSTVSYLLIFWIVDLGFVTYLKKMLISVIMTLEVESGPVIERQLLVYFYEVPFPKEAYNFIFLPYLLGSIFLLGSIYFRNFQYIKTAISLFAYVILFAFCMYKASRWFMEGTISLEGDGFWQSKPTVFTVVCVSGIVLTALFWIVAYLRLKEKEV